MMGTQSAPPQLFYDFRLDDHVPADHLLRRIDQFLDLEPVREELRPFYCSIGRPSIDPELMMRMLIVGYCMGIRSERRLCEEVHLNLAYRWFCRLGLEGKVPDHSTFSRNRHGRFRQSDILRRLFEMVVERCLAEGLVGGEGFAVDASLIAADANKQRSVPSEDWRPPQDPGVAVREYLERLDDAAFGAASPVTPNHSSGLRSGDVASHTRLLTATDLPTPLETRRWVAMAAPTVALSALSNRSSTTGWSEPDGGMSESSVAAGDAVRSGARSSCSSTRRYEAAASSYFSCEK